VRERQITQQSSRVPKCNRPRGLSLKHHKLIASLCSLNCFHVHNMRVYLGHTKDAREDYRECRTHTAREDRAGEKLHCLAAPYPISVQPVIGSSSTWYWHYTPRRSVWHLITDQLRKTNKQHSRSLLPGNATLALIILYTNNFTLCTCIWKTREMP
jgi:hypothetical protein